MARAKATEATHLLMRAVALTQLQTTDYLRAGFERVVHSHWKSVTQSGLKTASRHTESKNKLLIAAKNLQKLQAMTTIAGNETMKSLEKKHSAFLLSCLLCEVGLAVAS